MKALIIIIACLLPLALSARGDFILEQPFIAKGVVDFSFVVLLDTNGNFLVNVAIKGRGNLAVSTDYAAIVKPVGWKSGDNPFSDKNGDGYQNIKDVFGWLNIDDIYGNYEQGTSSSVDPVWRGSYTVIGFVAAA